MVDYDKRTGGAGTLRIRDLGWQVQYWVLCSDGATTSTVNYQIHSDGQWHNGSVSLPAGFGERHVASFDATYSQAVRFNISATGTWGLGGPTEHSATVSRTPAPPTGTVPPAPSVVFPGESNPDNITASGMRVRFSSTGDGGAPVSGWDLQRATDAAFTQGVYWQLSYGTTWDENLPAGIQQYYRARGVNGYGPGAWSATVNATTLIDVQVSDGAAWKPADLLVSDGAAWKPADLLVSDGAAWLVSA